MKEITYAAAAPRRMAFAAIKSGAVAALSALPPGTAARVVQLNTPGDMRRRLLDMGLVEGARVESLFAGPSGDPVAYLVKGAVVALRAEDARTVLVRGEW